MTSKIISIILCAIVIILGFALWAGEHFDTGPMSLGPVIIFCLGLVGLAIVLGQTTRRE